MPIPTDTPVAALFDLDGTLIDSADCIVSSTQDAFAHYQLPVPSTDTVRGLMGIPIEKSFGLMAGSAGAGLDAAEIIAYYRGLVLERSTRMIHAFPGIADLLGDLREEGVRIGIVTSKKSHTARHNLDHTGLASFIEAAVCSDEVQHYKPHPQTVHLALERLGLPDASAAVVVGDATFDIEMGHAAGTQTCAAMWGAFDTAAMLACRPTYVATNVAGLRSVFLGRPRADRSGAPT